MLGVAVGLVAGTHRVRSWIATALITVVLVAVAWVTDTGYVAPLYVVVSGIVAIVVATHDLRESPLLEDEPWWRRLVVVAAHGGAVRKALVETERNEAAAMRRG